MNEIRDRFMCNEVGQPVRARVSEVCEIRDIYMRSEVDDNDEVMLNVLRCQLTY